MANVKKTNVLAAEVKEAAPAVEVKTEKPAEKKIAEKKAASENKPAAKKPAAKKTAKKAAVTYWDVVDGLKAKVAKATAPVDVSVAAQVKIDGSAEGIFYILVANGVAVVEPFDYKGADIEINADADALAAVINGKKEISEVIADGSVKMQGNAGKAILLAKAVF
ncbi:MAG: SCP2 sterol-binding domain-containing protein [Huintestinicola sp.]